MKLFHKRPSTAELGGTGTGTVSPAPPETVSQIPLKIEIHMTEEQKALLDTPIDPRVDKIMRQLYADRTEAEAALKAGRRPGDTKNHQVVQDPNGFWRIAKGPAPATPANLLNGL